MANEVSRISDVEKKEGFGESKPRVRSKKSPYPIEATIQQTPTGKAPPPWIDSRLGGMFHPI